MRPLSKKTSLCIFWTFLALILCTIITSLLTEWEAIVYVMKGLFVALLLFCGIQIYTLTQRSVCKKTVMSMAVSTLIIFTLMTALSFVLGIYDTVAETVKNNLFMSCMAIVIDNWYCAINKQNK